MPWEHNSLAIAHNPMSTRIPNPITNAHMHIKGRRITAIHAVVTQKLDSPRTYVLPSDQISIEISAATALTCEFRLRLICMASRLVSGSSNRTNTVVPHWIAYLSR
jgi:hypothetical protein